MVARRRLLLVIGGAALLNVVPVRARATEVHVLAGEAFGSTWRLVLPASSESQRAGARLRSVVARVDALMSPFRAGSDLGRFNSAGSAVLSPETRLVTLAALYLARDSDGAFDPTVAPVGARYGFGPLAISPARPAGWHGDLRVHGNVLGTARAGLSLDLCGIAKGHALDEIARALEGLDFLLELGGEVVARGRHPSGRPWRVGIEQPGTGKLARVLDADRRALATSGDAAQGYGIGGRVYSHVMDPSARAPLDNGVASVSVLAATGMMADGLATAAMVLGPQRARRLLAANDASALFLMRRPGGLEELSVNRFTTGGA